MMTENRFIDTGDSVPRGEWILSRVQKKIVKEKGCRLWNPIIDDSGRIFGFEAVSKEGLHFYCVARSTEPMRVAGREIVSCQTRFISRCIKEQKPIVMSWPGTLYIFDPQMISIENFGENVRANLKADVKIKFLNFSVTIGLEWIEGSSLTDVWEKVKLIGRRNLRSYEGE